MCSTKCLYNTRFVLLSSYVNLPLATTVSAASALGPESWRLYEDLKKKFDGS